MTKPYLSERAVSIIENIPPKGVSFSDFIAIIAMSCQSFACFYFAILRSVKNSGIAKP